MMKPICGGSEFFLVWPVPKHSLGKVQKRNLWGVLSHSKTLHWAAKWAQNLCCAAWNKMVETPYGHFAAKPLQHTVSNKSNTNSNKSKFVFV